MKIKQLVVVLLLLLASLLPELIVNEYQVKWVRLIVLAVGAFVFLIGKNLRDLFKFTVILTAINASFLLMDVIRSITFWKDLFSFHSFFTSIANTVAAKFVCILPVIAVLFILLKKAENFYLVPGNWSVKANAIFWLGIDKDKISWKKLSVIAGLCIMAGTILLTLITTTGFHIPRELDRLLLNFPIILALAFVNSFCEGVIYRTAIMGPLREHFSKSFVVLMSALFFGIAHYQGVPGGILGSLMSGLLGWFMARSMYETKGFASAWVIHFLQDTAIFSTLLLIG